MVRSVLGVGSTLILVLLATPTLAQSITAAPDGTGTVVTLEGNTYHIKGGTPAGANLFHSFQALGLNSGEIANFLSDPGITNVFGRVTGGSPSVIDGLVQVTGANSNLYLMNPAGIVFGAGASLNVGGDFYATTSDRIGFEQGWFNATGTNDYDKLVGAPNQFAFASKNPSAIVNFGDLSNAQNVSLLGGTVINQGKVSSTQGNVTLAAIPGERLVKISQPGMLLSLEIPAAALTAGFKPTDLPTLLTGAEPLHSPVIAPNLVGGGTGAIPLQYSEGDVIVAGEVQGEQVDLYAAGQVKPTHADLIQGETRVVRFSATGENPSQAVFIDEKADHPTDLLFGTEAGTIAQIIKKDKNGISVISEQLAVISDAVGELESVAIVAEGNAGNFWLGSEWIRAENIGDYAAQLQTWGDALTTNADILLYSCFTALGATGEALVQSIADMTRTDVAASIDATGSVNYGGDWVLEASSGEIEATNPFLSKTLADWDGKLAIRTVSSNADAGTGTLRDALTVGVGFGGALAAGDTINFSFSGTITLTGVDINWTADNVTIDGSGQTIVIDGGANDNVFVVNANNATIQNLTIQNGSSTGRGGAIDHQGVGTLAITNSTITGNSASTDGGGIYSTGTVSLTNSTVSGNITNVDGGGVHSTGSLTLTASTVSGNTAMNYGGGLFLDNTAGNLTLSDSTLSGNSASAKGGGVDSNGSTTLTNSTISGNSSINGGGINFENSAETLAVINSTLSGNGALGTGGGIRSGGTVTLTNATIAFNTADSDGNGGGNGGGVYIGGGTYSNQFINSIVANNTDGSPASEVPDISANLSTSTVRHNLITSTNGISGLTLTNGVNGNIIGQDPLLGPLQNNGGTTQTHALLSGSPAINAGDNSVVTLSIDQAGNLRIVNNTVDIGAFEFQTETTVGTTPICELTCPLLTPLIIEPLAASTTILDPGIADLEIQLTNDYADALEMQLTGDFATVGADGTIATVSLADIQNILRDINRQTGTEPALIYFTFLPTLLPEQAHPVPETLIASRALEPWHWDLAQGLSGIEPRDDDELQLILVTPLGYPVLRRPGVSRAEVAQQVRQFRRGLGNVASQRYLQPAQQLYDWLIRPLEKDLENWGIDNLSIIAAEGLRSLPMSALHDGDRFLVEDYSVGLIPSMSLIDWRYRSLQDATVLAMGASEFTQQATLPAVPTELQLITAQNPEQQYLNDAFTYENLQAQTRDRNFEILHLATHATFQAGAAEAAYIQLWGENDLQLKDLRDLKLYENPPIELLVLSACETALGDARTELGFAGAALQAGVKSVLASLWQVSDLGTLALMSAFYDELADTEVTIKAKALQQAQLALLRGELSVQAGYLGELALPPEIAQYANTDLSHPFYWSAFTLVGSPW
ncbi:MAG: CHAT domain-containing protein [Spirulina sp. SIO3F2]|nr:CHAT domain-containing protein [Spirulina sp. SIO3F2]